MDNQDKTHSFQKSLVCIIIKSVWEWVNECDSVGKYHQIIYMFEYIPFGTQLINIGWSYVECM